MTICFYCSEREADSSDHIISRKSGGPDNEPWNFVPACRQCNSRKGPTDLYTFLQISGCYEDWDESHRQTLMEKLAIALMRGFINQRQLTKIRTLIYPRNLATVENYDWGTIQSCGVGLRTGEVKAIEAIGEIEDMTKNKLMRLAIRHFITEYLSGKVELKSL